MGHKISGITAISFLSAVGLTGCVDTLKLLIGNSIEGSWSMSSLDGQCQDIGDDSFCFNFAEFYFTAADDGGDITVSETTINGDLEILEQGEEFVANFYSTEQAQMAESFMEDDVYLIGASVGVDMEGEVLVEFELSCSLTGDLLDCDLSSVLIDGEEDTEDYISDWHIVFERAE